MPDTSAKSSTSERACDACRIRKLKCPSLLAHKSTGQPCARCIKTGLICTYDAPPRKRGPASGKRLSALRENQNFHHDRSSSSSSPPSQARLPMPLPQPPVEPPEPTYLPVGMPMPLPAPEDRPIAVIDSYYEFGYAAFPVLDREILLARVDQSHQLTELDFQCLIRALAAFNEACKLRSDPGRGEGRLLNLVAAVQQTRSRYDFSEQPTLDTVVASLFLFVAYNVMGRHKRAFLFLTEAVGLLDSLEPPRDDVERIRLTRVEYVVFVTENASVSIYGTANKRKLARRPGHFVQAAESLLLPSHRVTGGRRPEEIERLDRDAVDLLVRMTQLHAAQDINELMNIGVSPPQPLPGHVSTQDERLYLTQFADVAITRQWMVATKLPLLFNSCQNNPLAIAGLAMILQEMGASVLQWIASLPSGQLRIVGLGKVTHIARTIHSLAMQLGEQRMFDGMLRDMVIAISENDHEGNYLPLLSDCVQKFYPEIPPSAGVIQPSFASQPQQQREPPPFLSLNMSNNYLPTPPSATRTASDDVDIILESPVVQEMNAGGSAWQAPTMWDSFGSQTGDPMPSTSDTIIEDDAQFQASLAQLLGI